MLTDRVEQEQFVNGILRLVKYLNSFNSDESAKESYLKFYVEDYHVGYIWKEFAKIFSKYEKVFTVNNLKVSLHEDLKTFDEKTEAVEKALIDMRDKKYFKDLDGWRNEHYFVRTRFSAKAVFKVERASSSLLGIKTYGCNVNGYVKKDNNYYIWIARRSKTKQTYPGMLDNFTGGGLTAGLGVVECARKELEEEAGVSMELSSKIKSTGAITYAFVNKFNQLTIEGEFIFDIKLPSDFIPKNVDGEVDSFNLLSIDQVKKAIISDDFKPNSAAVTLDFLFRKSLLTPDELPCYLEILENLHAPGL